MKAHAVRYANQHCFDLAPIAKDSLDSVQQTLFPSLLELLRIN